MFDGKGAIMNENRDWEEVYQRWSIDVLPTRDGNEFTINVSTRDKYITNNTLVSHLGNYSFAHGV